MRAANLRGRAVLVTEDHRAIDIERASGARFPSDPQALFSQWSELEEWAAALDPATPAESFDRADLGAAVPAPRQVFAIGLNYRDHATESGFAVPDSPTVFTKFVSCLTGPVGTIALPRGGNTDWEVELVVVIGREAHHVDEADAWDHVAGLTVGQDISERITQASGPAPQFSLGKSFPGFGPVGPWVVSPGDLPERDAIRLGCRINGIPMQSGTTSDLVFSVPALISKLSATVTLLPGDLIFTGTPSGVGLGRRPQVWLRPGDVLETWIEGIGEMRHVMTD